jgi:hypothetical protein
MGELADDMVDGTSCQLCGVYFFDKDNTNVLPTHDYPVVCWDCWDDLSKKERKQYQRSLFPTLGDQHDEG